MINIITAIFLIIFPFYVNANEQQKPLKIAVSIKPIHSIVSYITDGVLQPDLLITGNASPHDYSFKPSTAKKINEADIIILTSAELETFLRKPLESYKNDKIIIELVKTEGMNLHYNRSKSHDNEQQNGHLEHDHGEVDPHIWLSPKNALTAARNIANVLAEEDSLNGYIYKNNLASFRERIDSFDKSLTEELNASSNIPFLVFHDAFQYFEKHYKLNNMGSISNLSGTSIGAKHLKEVESIIEKENISCIFTEPQFSDSIIKNISGSSDIRIKMLDPLGSEIDAGKDSYFNILNKIANNFKSCLKG